MGDGLRAIRVVSHDDSLLASVRHAATLLDGFDVVAHATVDELVAAPPVAGDVILLDAWMRGGNVYEQCRRLVGKTRCRTWVVVDHQNQLAESIARFCGATGVLRRPLVPSKLKEALESSFGPRPNLPQEARGSDKLAALPERLLTDLAGKRDETLVSAATDPETSLYNYAFLNYKLDEEFKRAKRFGTPLSVVMLGFEGAAEPSVLKELAAIFLETSRDTDVLGRFDENTFLFFLPHTGLDGAGIMARRVGEMAAQRGLSDLVGDALQISVGIATCPAPDIQRREDLFSRARGALLAARQQGGGVVAV